MQDAEIPVLNPASIQDVLDYGLHGWAMSRFSGGWSAMIALADTMDSGAVVDVSLDRMNFVMPDFEFPSDGVHMRRADPSVGERTSPARVQASSGASLGPGPISSIA